VDADIKLIHTIKRLHQKVMIMSSLLSNSQRVTIARAEPHKNEI